MSDTDPIADLFMLIALWATGCGLAAARWLDCRRLGIVVALAALTLVPVGRIAGWSERVALPAALVGGAYCVAVIGFRFGERLRWFASSRHAQALALLAGPLLACGWFALDEPEVPALPTEGEVKFTARPAGDPVSQPAATDCGRPVRLFTHQPANFSSVEARIMEHRATMGYPLGLIRTSEPTCIYNCHGWIFAGGQYWVHNEDVETILRDNQYEIVSQPRPGDLVVYRDSDSRPTHTGVVRVSAGETVVIESKWGPLGRYLHAPAAQPYGASWSFYRSPRAGHVLSEIDSSAVPTP